jgi:hypothetical protein
LTGLNPRLSAADAAMPERPRAPAFFMRGKYRFPPHAAIPVPLPVPLAPLTTSPPQKRQKGQKKLAFSKTLRYTFFIKKTIMSNN